MIMEQPEYTRQELKTMLMDKFVGTKTYLGSQVIHAIHGTSFNIKQEVNIIEDEDVKKGDVFWYYENKKARPAVVINFNVKTHLCQVIKLTTTENIHNMAISVDSRFAKDSFYSYGFELVRADYVARNFFFHIENKKNLNLAIKENKRFFNIR